MEDISDVSKLHYDIFISGFDGSARTKSVYDRITAQEKYWIVFPQCTQYNCPLPYKYLTSGALIEDEFILDVMNGVIVKDKTVCLDATGFLIPHLLFLIQHLQRQGMKKIDVLYSEPASYVRAEDTEFTKSIDMPRPIEGYITYKKNINGNDFPACLSTLLFKNEKVLDYYEYTDTIVDLIAYFEDVDTTNLDSDVRLINLIKLYYRHKPVIIPDDYHSKAKSYDYDTYALNIIGEFYLTDLDIEYLDQLLLKSSTNDMHETLSIYYTRNGQDGESFKQKVLSHNPLAKKEIK